jgi:cytidylate kinase
MREEEDARARQGRTSGLRLQLATITVGGLPGSGKSTFAKLLASKMGLEYLSAGQVFRQMAVESGMDLETFSKRAEGDHAIDRRLDRMQVRLARGKEIVVDSRLSAWMIKKPDLKVCLVAGFEERAKRIAERDGLSTEEAIRRVREREDSERRRYRQIYNIDIGDVEVYDIVVNSGTYLPEEIVAIVRKALDALGARSKPRRSR